MGLYNLLIVISLKNEIKMKNHSLSPEKMKEDSPKRLEWENPFVFVYID